MLRSKKVYTLAITHYNAIDLATHTSPISQRNRAHNSSSGAQTAHATTTTAFNATAVHSAPTSPTEL